MKKILVALLALTSFIIHAKEVEAILLTTDDNVNVGFLLNETLSIIFKENALELSDRNNSISYPFENIIKICYVSNDELNSLSIEDLMNSENIIFLQIQNDCLYIKNALNKTVRIYNANANLMKEFFVNDNECKLNLSEFPKGLSIINCNHQSLKLQIK